MGIETAILGSAIIGGASSAYGASRAASESRRAQDTATAEQRRQFDLVREDTAGQRQLGNDAISRIRQLYGYGAPASQQSFQTIETPFGPMVVPINGPPQQGSSAPDMSGFFASPDYQFNLGQGQQAIDRSAAARSGLLSGRAVKEGQRYASGLASREFGGFMDRLFQQAGIGSTGIGASAAAGANAANNIGAYAMNGANTRGSAYMAGAQGVNNAVQGGLSNLLLQRYLTPSGVGGGSYLGSAVRG